MPARVRERLITVVGPDASGSGPGSEGCHHSPEKSGVTVVSPAAPVTPQQAARIMAGKKSRIVCPPAYRQIISRPRRFNMPDVAGYTDFRRPALGPREVKMNFTISASVLAGAAAISLL